MFNNIKRDERTGIAYMDDPQTGARATIHPCIHYTGSVSGMRKNFGWKRGDRIKQFGGYKYNIDQLVFDHTSVIDQRLRSMCRCGGNHGYGIFR